MRIPSDGNLISFVLLVSFNRYSRSFARFWSWALGDLGPVFRKIKMKLNEVLDGTEDEQDRNYQQQVGLSISFASSPLNTMAMQDVINKMKGTALGVAEYLTPVLKVSSFSILSDSFWSNYGNSVVTLSLVSVSQYSCNFFCQRTYLQVIN